MKLGQKPPLIWHRPAELKSSFSRFGAQINKLLLLETLWEKAAGGKAKFWPLYAVKGGIIYIRAGSSAARAELALRERDLVKELNKHFDKAWVKQISAV